MVKVHGSPATGEPWLSTTVQLTVTLAPVLGAGLLAPAVTLPTGGGYWAKAMAQDATRAIRIPTPARDRGRKALRNSLIIVRASFRLTSGLPEGSHSGPSHGEGLARSLQTSPRSLPWFLQVWLTLERATFPPVNAPGN
jgi:hypothetical protein